jgi:hypothetical protein
MLFDDFIRNNYYDPRSCDDENAYYHIGSATIGIIVNLTVLFLSYSQHKFSYKTVSKVCTDVASGSALCTLIIMLCVHAFRCDRYHMAILNLIYNVLFNSIFQLAESYMTYNRYAVVCHPGGIVPLYHRVILVVLGSLLMFLSWMSLFAIFPIFYDMNSSSGRDLFFLFYDLIYVPSYLLFNITYTMLVVRQIQLLRVYTEHLESQDAHDTLLLVAYKSILYNIIASVSFLSTLFIDIYVWVSVVPLSLHLLFNISAESGMFNRCCVRSCLRSNELEVNNVQVIDSDTVIIARSSDIMISSLQQQTELVSEEYNI